jgi:hypothetical protein
MQSISVSKGTEFYTMAGTFICPRTNMEERRAADAAILTWKVEASVPTSSLAEPCRDGLSRPRVVSSTVRPKQVRVFGVSGLDFSPGLGSKQP